MKILIVDDSRAMRAIVMRTLRQAGYSGHTILQAGNGAEALSLVQAQAPDLVICDWNMPQMTGIDLLQALRAEDNTTVFGFITTESTPEQRKLAMDSGAAFLITKPFTPTDVQEALNPYLD